MAGPTIDRAFIVKFNEDVHMDYQQKGSKLRGTIRTDADVKAEKVRFQILGQVAARAKARNGNIPPSNPDHSFVEATMLDRYTLDFVDQLDLTKLNIEIRNSYVRNHSWAFARETDDQIITAMQAGVTDTFSAGGLFDRNTMLEAAERLDRNDVDRDGNWWCPVTPRQWASLMTVEEFASGDFVGPSLPFMQNIDARTWMGIHFLIHNRLPGVGTNAARVFMYHMSSVGHGINSEVDITWDWENEKKAWSAAGSMSMNAVVIDPRGIIGVDVDDTAALP